MGKRLLGTTQNRSASPVLNRRQVALLILLSLATAAGNAQLTTQNTQLQNQLQNSVSSDCSDPILATSAECTSQAQQGGNASASNPMAPSATPGDYTSDTHANDTGLDSLDQSSRLTARRDQAQALQIPPQPLTEFQKFVASTTGRVLPIFGADLFRRIPSTFAPLDMTPVPADYVVGPSDELRIHVWGQVNFQTPVRVDRSGEIFLPQVGPVHVAGVKYSDLDAHLRAAVGRIFHNFDLTVDVGQIRAIQVFVAGQARRPGVYTVSSLSSLTNTLFASGGPSESGSMRHIEVRRGGTVVTDFDLYDFLINGDKTKDVKLQSEDVIFIPPVGPEVAVTGSVRNAAIYEMRADETLASLLSHAGGVSAVAAEARVSIERIEDHRARQAMEVSYDEAGLATPLADGDLVRVYSIVPKYQKTVIIRGNIANTGRFAWHEGMHVSDLIPDKDSLITRNYWWKRAQLGMPGPEFEPTSGLDNLHQPADSHDVSVERLIRNSSAASSRSGNQQAQSGSQPGASGASGSPTTQAGQSASQQSQTGSSMDQSGSADDQSGSQTSPASNPDERSGSASVASAQTSTAGRQLSPSERTDVKALAPEIDWDYAVIERLNTETLKTVLIPFDLGKLVLEHDGGQDLQLQAGDVISIFSEADIRVPIAHQTKFVRLDGEIAHAGVYTAQPGETLRQLVQRAGGVTSAAYMYGSEFTRESTRAIQQARIDDYIQNLGMQIQRRGLAAGAPTAGGEPDLLASLRRVRASGRIVLQFTPSSIGNESVPDLPLEDGDHFVIPPTPAAVNVVGAVYNQNSFLYNRNRKIGTYLRMAGGPNRDADHGHEFVIRADGEVVSRARSKTLLGSNNFEGLNVNPGDTVVVPDKTFRPSVFNNVLNSAQALANVAIDAVLLTSIQ